MFKYLLSDSLLCLLDFAGQIFRCLLVTRDTRMVWYHQGQRKRSLATIEFLGSPHGFFPDSSILCPFTIWALCAIVNRMNMQYYSFRRILLLLLLFSNIILFARAHVFHKLRWAGRVGVGYIHSSDSVKFLLMALFRF